MAVRLESETSARKGVFLNNWNRYTASCGERRIRVHTAAAPIVTNLVDMYRLADTGAIVSLFSRLGRVT